MYDQPPPAAEPRADAVTNPVLRVRNLTTAFRRDDMWTEVIRNISFHIDPGETLAVVGESGSGKSVTANSIMRLLPQHSSRITGQVEFAGRSLLELPESAMRRIRGNEIGMIFQEAGLNPTYTVGFQLIETLRQHRRMGHAEARAEATRLLERVRIPAAARRMADYPHKLSGGMRQRVSIAMAMACKPRLLIADEPTTALDVTVQAQILELIKQLQEEEAMSVLFITHDMGVVAEISDRTLVMLRGDCVETAPTADLFRAPRAAYTRRLMAAVPVLGAMQGCDTPQPFPRLDPETGRPEPAAEQPRTVRADQPPVLEVEDLVVRFDLRGGLMNRVSARVHAVEGVSFHVMPGETLSIVGESGCGKSTTARAVMRLQQPGAGRIRVAGQDISRLDGKGLVRLRRDCQMVFQDPYASLNGRMKIGDAIAEPILQHAILPRAQVRARVGALLEQVGLSAEMAGRYPHQFSGGQRQRICIARALAFEPKLIVADEAVSALDVSIKAQVVNLMLELQASLGLSFLFISHDMAIVERLSHRVAVMYLGRIVEIGPRAAIFDHPAHPYTRRLISAVPATDPTNRHLRRDFSASEISSPVRALDYRVPDLPMRQVGPGHFVREPE